MSERPAIEFPNDFAWGAATASYQIEGAVHEDGRGQTVWDRFSHTEGKVANGDTGDVACDHYHRVDADVALMAELGLQTYRFSIAWSRVMPDGRSGVNRAGLDWYHRLVDRLLEHGITPCPTLFHWDLPTGLEDIGGFRNRDTVSWFADYAALMAQELGDRVTMWSTFNEPWCYAYLGHASGVHAPGLRDDRAAVTVAHHELLAHGLALQAMRAERDGLALGIVINPAPVVAEGSPAADPDEMRMIDGIHNRWWFDGVLRGEYPADVMERYGDLAAAVHDGDLDVVSQPLDWIGVNYYFDTLVRGATTDDDTRHDGRHDGGRDGGGADPMPEYPTVVRTAPAPTRPVHTDMGWPITPDGFHELLTRLDRDYPNLPPVYITENGAAFDDPVVDGRCVDTRRIDYLDLHLRAVHAAIADGVDVRGYYQWSLLDNFEWALGYAKRFGIVHVDFDTLERTPRDSARWYADVIRRNGLPARET